MTSKPVWNMTTAERELYREERASAALAAVRAGKTTREIEGRGARKTRIPAIWTRESIIKYKADNPIWAEEFDRLARLNAAQKQWSKGVRREQTHCKNGHPLSGDNITYYSRKGRTDRFRRCKTCDRARDARAHVSPEQARAALQALRSGETITSITRAGPSFVLGYRAIAVLRTREPKLDKLIANLSSKNAKPRWLEAMRKRRVHVAPQALSNNIGVLDRINAAIPRYLSETDRQDIIADMWTAVAEGKLRPADIAREVKSFIRAHHKMYQTTDRWGPKSLDAPAYLDSPVSLVETLRDDQALWR